MAAVLSAGSSPASTPPDSVISLHEYESNSSIQVTASLCIKTKFTLMFFSQIMDYKDTEAAISTVTYNKNEIEACHKAIYFTTLLHVPQPSCFLLCLF